MPQKQAVFGAFSLTLTRGHQPGLQEAVPGRTDYARTNLETVSTWGVCGN
jgi:hypothetical protein